MWIDWELLESFQFCLVVPCAVEEASLDLSLDWARTLLTHPPLRALAQRCASGADVETSWKLNKKPFLVVERNEPVETVDWLGVAGKPWLALWFPVLRTKLPWI